MNKYDINEHILLNYFSGLLTLPEKKAVDEWIDESEENKKLAQDVHYLFLATNAIERINRIDSYKALEDVNRKIKSRKQIAWTIWFQRVAAVLLLPLIGITLYLLLKPQEAVEDIELKTNPGVYALVALPDGSTAYLNSMSSLKYASRFEGNTREVYLDGEGYFLVKPNPSKPFIVNTPFNLKAEVLGTEFNIEAYGNSTEVKTLLVSGSVRLHYNDENRKEQFYTLQPEEEFNYLVKSATYALNHPYIPTQIAWKDGRVVLKNTSLEETLKILSKRFNVEFIVKNTKLYDNSFTYTSEEQHLLFYLNAFMLTGIQYRFIESEKSSSEDLTPKSVVELY
ncbi:FecR family protein [Bacteroides sp. 519]|uniref:FecR family protein n=1 Tax=Bacteroides sp. 519 TaxID=2302937 RepID=UPI0013D45090|nr:FecR family protein [Bacteroides sp. 519]NDV57896.1 FecR family protein [Bacteroides sp. 519]